MVSILFMELFFGDPKMSLLWQGRKNTFKTLESFFEESQYNSSKGKS